MNLGFALLLGIVQGLTEFLPISSSGHLVLIQTLSGVDVEGGYMFFDLLLHLGTLLAVVFAFRRDIGELIVEFFRMAGDGFKLRDNANRRFIVMLLLSMLPMLLILPVKSKLDVLFESPRLVGVGLLITAVLLFVSDRVRAGRKTAKDAKWRDALIVGVMQAVAVVPGISRSGATMTGGVFRGFTRDFAVRFAFIMSIPVILGSNILSIGDALGNAAAHAGMLPAYIVGTVAAAVSGYFAIFLTKYLVKKRGFTVFSVYCLIVGIITLIATSL